MMVRSSGIREKLRSNTLKELARERATKRPRAEVDDDGDSQDELEIKRQERMMNKAKCASNSLLSLLPKPKHSSVFGPTVRLDKLLKMPERADDMQLGTKVEEPVERLTEDGMIEVDVSKVVSDINQTLIKDLTIEKPRSVPVIVAKGKEKQKNQITYLAQLGKALELDRKEQAAQSRLNKAAARSKYGW